MELNEEAAGADQDDEPNDSQPPSQERPANTAREPTAPAPNGPEVDGDDGAATTARPILGAAPIVGKKKGIGRPPRRKHTRFTPKKKSAPKEKPAPLQPGETGYYKWGKNKFWRILGISRERKVGKTMEYYVHWRGVDQEGQEWEPSWAKEDWISHEAYQDWVKRKREGREAEIDPNVSGRKYPGIGKRVWDRRTLRMRWRKKIPMKKTRGSREMIN